jgi:hypothetical protein
VETNSDTSQHHDSPPILHQFSHASLPTGAPSHTFPPSPPSLCKMLAFYAELLPNIKSISLLISLPTSANASTRATVDPGSTTAVLYHNGETTPLILPAQANPGPRQLVLTTTLGEKTLSSRLPLAAPSTTASYDNENYAPWSALQLSSKESVSYCCRACKAVVLPSGRIQKWKNLPSGNWADMMDFWHCHKPHDHDKEKANKESKESNGGGRYSTFGQGFAVEQGVGLVDRGYFLFSSKDCDNVQVSHLQLLLINDTCRSTPVSRPMFSCIPKFLVLCVCWVKRRGRTVILWHQWFWLPIQLP